MKKPRCRREHLEDLSLLGLVRRLDVLRFRLQVGRNGMISMLSPSHVAQEYSTAPTAKDGPTTCPLRHTDEASLDDLLEACKLLGLRVLHDPDVPAGVIRMEVVMPEARK